MGSKIAKIERRGKFLLFNLAHESCNYWLAVNQKLTGRFALAPHTQKRLKYTHVIFAFDECDLRYMDSRKMGQLYLARDLSQVPGLSDLGPDAMRISSEEFNERLRQFRGEIKGILTREGCVSGIGNAYADEILWTAKIYPFKKRTQLTGSEIAALCAAVQSTLQGAIGIVRSEMGEHIELKPREFLSVHMKSGEPCPRCGTSISLVGANQRITNFCRQCQPGSLTRGWQPAEPSQRQHPRAEKGGK